MEQALGGPLSLKTKMSARTRTAAAAVATGVGGGRGGGNGNSQFAMGEGGTWVHRATGAPLSAREVEDMVSSAKREAYLIELKARYETGSLPLQELVDCRREICTLLYDKLLEGSYERANSLETQLHAFATEEIPMRASEYLDRLSESVAASRAWVQRWRAALQVLEGEVADLPELSDPLLSLKSSRLRFRIDIARLRMSCEEDIAGLAEKEINMFKRLALWGERVARKLEQRRAHDAEEIKRLDRQIPEARAALTFIARRKRQLMHAYSIFNRGNLVAQSKMVWKASDLLSNVLSARDKALEAQREDETDLPPPPSSPAAAAAQEAAPTGGKERREKAPVFSSTAVPEEDAAEAELRKDPNYYDWKRTDEWALEKPREGERPGPDGHIYVHVPTQMRLPKRPTEPPPGYGFPPRFRKKDLISPSQLPSALPAPPPHRGMPARTPLPWPSWPSPRPLPPGALPRKPRPLPPRQWRPTLHPMAAQGRWRAALLALRQRPPQTPALVRGGWGVLPQQLQQHLQPPPRTARLRR
jgi:hypothetical protein